MTDGFTSPALQYPAKIFPRVESSQPGTTIGKFFWLLLTNQQCSGLPSYLSFNSSDNKI